VLIVDDSTCFRRVARELLARRGYTVVGEAESGERALDLVRRLTPDAVLLDVRLPDATGFQIAAAIAGGPSAPAVLLASSDVALESYSLVERSGARGLVAKEELAAIDFARFWAEVGPGALGA
jgi:DNA-binding NarL/FixJ family response regulator